MKRLTFLSAALVFAVSSLAQTIVKPVITLSATSESAAKRTEMDSATKLEIPTALNFIDTTLFPVISAVNPKPRIELSYLTEFENFKDTATLIYNQEIKEFEPKTPVPIRIAFGFDGNIGDDSAPLDNTIGCSGENYSVSISNSYIEYYEGNNLKYRSDLGSFINYEIPSPCDPKVYFDASTKRFILFLQKCDDAIQLNSSIIVGFSKSSNPLDGWNFYRISGNALKKPNHWFDYPKIGISDDGLFISGNIFIGKPPRSTFAQTIVFQIDKNLGFSGKQLKYCIWYDIDDNPFTIMPVSYGFNNTYGKGVYLLSTTWQQGADYFKLYDITSDIYDPKAVMKFYKVKTTPYNFFGAAVQINQRIDNGDIRIQDAILCWNKIYFVFTSGNERNFSRVNFNILDIPQLKNRSFLIGDKPNYSYAYPSLHMFSQENDPPTVLIQYNGTSYQSYPDIRCTLSDDNFNCSQEILIKSGESTINNYDRWGDYSGVAKNQTNKYQLWLSSSYGKNKRRQTYIAHVVSLNQPAIPEDSLLLTQIYSSTKVNFNLNKPTDIQVFLKTANKTTLIYEGNAQKGENQFEIFTKELQKGTYTIEVIKKNSNKTLNSSTFKTEQSLKESINNFQ